MHVQIWPPSRRTPECVRDSTSLFVHLCLVHLQGAEPALLSCWYERMLSRSVLQIAGVVMAVWLTSFLLQHGPAFSGLAKQPFVTQQHLVPSCSACECMTHPENHCNGFIKEKIIIQMTTKEPSSSGARRRAQVMMACRSGAPRVSAWVMHSACTMTCVCVFERVHMCMRACACDSARVCVCACSTTLARETFFSTVSGSQARPEFPGLA